MRVLEGPHGSWAAPDGRSAVTVGVYDGVHRGHRALITALRARATELGLTLTVVTFRDHPATVLTPDAVPPRLTTLDQQLGLFADLGVEQVAVLDFDESLRNLSAEAFVTEVLVDGLDAAVVSVGEDFRFGRDQLGDCDLLAAMGARHGFELQPFGLVGDAGEAYRASAVRTALAAGDLGEAGRILGRRFAVRGEVVRGEGRGRSIGFPTANLGLAPRQALPKLGVYAVRVRLGEGMLDGVANVGVRPTFGGGGEVVEVHVLEAPAGGLDLYGRTIDVEFVSRIRDERRFDGVDELVAQIGRDAEEARVRLDEEAGAVS